MGVIEHSVVLRMLTRQPAIFRLSLRWAHSESLWTPSSQRVGALARKGKMCQVFDRWGVLHTLTELRIEACQVIQVKTTETDGYNALQIGTGNMKLKRVTKPMFYHFEKSDVWPKAHLREFRVSSDALLPAGTEILARHFVPGQFVDVAGVSKGKGYAGAMKRWGFDGQPASHGNSKTHRAIGSSGSSQDPGRVWPGKKMAGHMGVQRRTVLNLQIHMIDCIANSVFVKGCVPGAFDSVIEIRDAYLKRIDSSSKIVPPFPTYFPVPGDENVKLLEIEPPATNPLGHLGVELSQQRWDDWKEWYLYGQPRVVVENDGAEEP
eukprot:c12668_g1_i1.p1 GENE.c12668_g1_i1~~c12668_g1_i1.p1  ORF type:complete len:321 (-),score=61.92 c12668_g1_i1:30-992(-)